MTITFSSGSYLCNQAKCGLYFWGSHNHDGFWHMAISSISFKKYPFIAPNYAGGTLMGYNYLTGFIVYLFTQLRIPLFFVFFKLLPLLWFVGLTILVIFLGKKIKNSEKFISLLLFFLYFASSFTFVFPLFHKKSIWGSSTLLSLQSGQFLTNFPFALSLILLLSILLILKNEDYGLKSSLLLGLLIFINIGIKFYGGLISAFIVSFLYLINFLCTKKIVGLLIITMFVIGGILFFYNPFASIKSGSVFIFSPFATVHSIIEEKTLFYLKDMVNARYFLYENGGFGPRLLAIELFSTFLFLFFSLGLRIFGFIYFFVKLIKKEATSFDVSVFLSIVIAYLIPLFFIQKGDWWNTTQFYYYSLFLLNFFTAEFFYEFLKKKNKPFIFAILLIIIILTVPGNLDILREFTGFRSAAYVEKEEIEALNYLKKLPNGIVFNPIYEKKPKLILPNPIYEVYDTSYVSAFSHKQTYMNDLIQLRLMGINYQKRQIKIKQMDCDIFKEVEYTYLINKKDNKWIINCMKNRKGKIIFKNFLVTIYSS